MAYSQNRWEVQKILAAADIAKADAMQDDLDSPASQSIEFFEFISNSNMTWFFFPIKSTDTNTALFPR